MAYSSDLTINLVELDGSGGERKVSYTASAFVPTEPAFCGKGTATTSPAAVSLGSIATPKLFVLINDGAVEITLDLGTDNITVGASGSTTRPNFVVLSSIPAAPDVSTGSSTAAYRTFIME